MEKNKPKRFILGLMGLNKLNYVEAEKFVLDSYNLGVRYVDLTNDKSGEALIYCYLNNISLQAWSPLKISLSEGSFINSPKYVELNNYLDELSNKYEVSKVSIALSFIYTMPFNITPVVGVSSIAHLKDAMIAMNIKLTKKEWYKLYLLGKHKLP